MNLGTAEIPPPRPPAVPTPVDATAHEAVTPPKRRRATDHETLLIVDDQPENLSVLGELLQGAGYHVKVANNGHVALHLARQLPRPGLILRAVGENHDAAHGLGYPVRRVRILALAFGGALAGMGGAYVSIATVLQWTEGMTAGAGWIALAIVVFAQWNPWGVLAGAWLFGGVTVLQLRLQAAGVAVPVQLLSMAPYLATILVLVLISARQKFGRSAGGAAPGSLGRPFHALR